MSIAFTTQEPPAPSSLSALVLRMREMVALLRRLLGNFSRDGETFAFGRDVTVTGTLTATRVEGVRFVTFYKHGGD